MGGGRRGHVLGGWGRVIGWDALGLVMRGVHLARDTMVCAEHMWLTAGSINQSEKNKKKKRIKIGRIKTEYSRLFFTQTQTHTHTSTRSEEAQCRILELNLLISFSSTLYTTHKATEGCHSNAFGSGNFGSPNNVVSKMEIFVLITSTKNKFYYCIGSARFTIVLTPE